MIKNLLINNFKSHNTTNLTLSNLNILTGLNGTGKSSVIQSLLLLRQSFFKNRLEKGIELNKPLCEIGFGKDAIYSFANDDVIRFELEIDHQQKLAWKFIANDHSLDSTFLKSVSKTNFSNEELKKLSLFNSNFQYLSAERLSPQESYEKSNYVVEINRQLSEENGKGEFIAHYLNHFGEEIKVEINDLKHPNAKFDDLLSQTNAWLKEISPNVNVKIHEGDKNFEINYQFDVKGSLPTAEFSAKNVGFGITYVLPIIVAILSAEKGSLIIIENPEAHIHAAAQSKIAELMSIAAQNGIQIIIETHSDHIINGVLVAVKKYKQEQFGIAPDNVSLYYLDRDEAQHNTMATKIEISDDGKINKQPDGFFDQIEKDLGILMGF